MDSDSISGVLTFIVGMLIMAWNSSRPDVYSRYGHQVAKGGRR